MHDTTMMNAEFYEMLRQAESRIWNREFED
jgi:hypothetical protein